MDGLKLPFYKSRVPPTQPFLVLIFEETDSDGFHYQWNIDVGGNINDFFTSDDLCKGSDTNLLPHATNLLKSLIAKLKADYGLHVMHASTYIGSAGPSHFLRLGIIFKRRKILGETKQE